MSVVPGGEDNRNGSVGPRNNLENRPPSAIKPRAARRNAYINAALALTPSQRNFRSQVVDPPGSNSSMAACSSHTTPRMTAAKPMSIKDVRALTVTPAIVSLSRPSFRRR